ncbi:CGNR zinc finger domain-containing protein [Streptomyces sp. NPDC005899]|uniref:CGNR zinc finger domain-containing protein n=1 Tax=Streptomyces sp. NPDC005899 TaxID=3155716 RepID=UPI0033F94FBB
MPPSPVPDPRPLTGEPLALDLLNTRWIDAEGSHDLLDRPDGLALWLSTPAVREHLGSAQVPADRAALDHLLRVRGALDVLVATPGQPDPAALAALNEVLAYGRIRRSLDTDGRPGSAVEVEDASWSPAWHAAESWLRLMDDRPDRVRPCANDECVLHFYDVSKNGTRRWCSMAGCGNRAKAQRHYARHRTA